MNILRPTSLKDFIGNEKIKECLKIQIKSAKIQNKPLGHILNQGPYGCGKTSLAEIIAHEMGGTLHSVNAASLTTKKNLFELVCKIKQNDVVFIDEIHRLDIQLQEFFYPIMEDFKFSVPRPTKSMGEKSAFQEINVSPFTLIGATTDIGLVSGPFLSRFRTHYYLESYSIEDLTEIIAANAIKLKIEITTDALIEVARRSRMTPRVANARLEWINDYRLARGVQRVELRDAKDALNMQDVDDLGLEKNDRRYLAVLKQMKFKPIGIKSISSMTGLSEDTISKYIEPYLIAIEKIEISRSGRLLVLSEAEIEHARQMGEKINEIDIENDF